MVDAIADLATQLKNGSAVGKESVTIPASNLSLAIAEKLVSAGFAKDVVKHGKKGKKTLEIVLRYEKDGAPKVHGVARLSRLGRRLYVKQSKIRQVRGGTGVLILSTPQGIMTGEEARKARVGGETLFKIW